MNVQPAKKIGSFNKFNKLKITSIKPNGWLKELLLRQKNGLTGHIEVAGYPYNTCMWAGESMKGHSLAWWPYEQTAYFLDGAHRLGLLLGDEVLLSKVQENMKYVSKHLEPTGRYGTKLSERWWRWPYASFNRLFMTEYELSQNEAIINMMHCHYLTFTANDFCDDLELANIEELCWLYGITQDERLLELAEDAYQLFKSDLNNRNRDNGRNVESDIQFGTDMIPNHHGVVYLELVKIPAILYAYTGNKEYLFEAENGIAIMEKHHMLVSGLPSSTEHFEGISEVAGHETCNTATLPYSYGYLLRVNGDSTLADKIEKAVFNGALGSITKDFKAHQYFSAPNQFLSTLDSNPFGHHAARMAYVPGHDVECCTGNVNRFMPYYVEQMWLSSKDQGVVAALYGPSTVNLNVGKKQQPITIIEETNYPFQDQMKFKLQMDTDIEFPFYLRIPQWCEQAELYLNNKQLAVDLKPGTFYRFKQTFKNNDEVMLKLPMNLKINESVINGVAIERGPLVYSYPIKSVDRLVKDYEKSSNELPALERRPAEEWHYAMLSADVLTQVVVIETPLTNFPWDIEDTPVKLKVPVKKLTSWPLKQYEDHHSQAVITTTPSFPKDFKIESVTEYIELVPYGSTLLRLTIFPKVN